MAKESGIKSLENKANGKIADYRAAYDDLCDKVGIEKRYDRMATYPSKTVDKISKNGIIKVDESQLRIPQISSSTITEKINSGEYSTKMSQQQYLKHVQGSAQYEQYKSTRVRDGGNPQSVLSISEEEAQKIIIEKSGTGIVRVDRHGKAKPQESVNCGKVVGYYFAKGSYHKTSKVTIHYGKKVSHIVPIRGEDFD